MSRTSIVLEAPVSHHVCKWATMSSIIDEATAYGLSSRFPHEVLFGSRYVTLKRGNLVLLECADSLLKTVAILKSRDIAVKE